MDFRRSGPLDERRRRVLMDEIASPADAEHTDAAVGGSAKGPVRAYHESVLNQRQPRVTDLLPVRPLWVVVLLLLGLTGIATIETIHVHVATLRLPGGIPHPAALDARHRGSLDDWYASAMLSGAAALAVVVFGIRSHRVDDYRGRYRVWLWSAAALLWLSLDAATGIHEALGAALFFAAQHSAAMPATAVRDGCALAWIAAYGLVFGSLAMRLFFEVWPSRLGTLALFGASLLYVIAGLLELGTISVPATIVPGMVQSTIVLLAHFSLLAAVGFYSRHVLLDATGRLKVHIDPQRKTKAKRAKLKVVKSELATSPVAAGASGSADQLKIGSSASSAGKPGSVSITKSTLTSPASSDDDDEDDDDEQYAGMSRSERRRLKKMARREQRRAA